MSNFPSNDWRYSFYTLERATFDQVNDEKMKWTSPSEPLQWIPHVEQKGTIYPLELFEEVIDK